MTVRGTVHQFGWTRIVCFFAVPSVIAGRLRLQNAQVQDIVAVGKGCTELERFPRSKIDSLAAQLFEPLLADSSKLNLGSVNSLRTNQAGTVKGSPS